jgi:hypothetical protein
MDVNNHLTLSYLWVLGSYAWYRKYRRHPRQSGRFYSRATTVVYSP